MESNRIYLRALEPDDYLTSYQWRNDHALMRGVIEYPRYVSKEIERRWVLKAIEEHECGKALRLAICLKENDRHIGYIYLTNIDRQNRSCGISTLIGEKAYLKLGLASEARFLIFRYAFIELGLNRISARILSINKASINSVEKFGYIYEGTLRKAIFRNGSFHDVMLYSMLRDEFINKYLKNDLE